MKEEYNALIENKTWELVPQLQGKNVIGCKWVYKIKFRSNSDIEKFKATLIVKGFNQKKGVDYEEIFSPIIKINMIRIILSLDASIELEIMFS